MGFRRKPVEGYASIESLLDVDVDENLTVGAETAHLLLARGSLLHNHDGCFRI